MASTGNKRDKKHAFNDAVPGREQYDHGLPYQTNACTITGGPNQFASFPAVDCDNDGDCHCTFMSESHTNGKKGKK